MLVLLEMDIFGLYLAILRVSFRAALLPTERIFSGLVDCETFNRIWTGPSLKGRNENLQWREKKIRRFEERERETDFRFFGIYSEVADLEN